MLERISLTVSKLLVFDGSALKRQEGQGVTEYALVLAFVAIALVAILTILRGGISTFVNAVNTAISALPGFS
jgi:Flp pilus assembly pilin Flp